MLRLIGLVIFAPVLFVLYAAAKSYYNAWQYDRKAAAMGCKPTHLRPFKYPGGIDMITRIFKADKEHKVPTEFDRIFLELGGKTTWRQYFFGQLIFLTMEPKNIQALLATQFKDFELGPMRRGNFFPMLGNGIFTADGAEWSHARGLLRPQFARDQVGQLDLEERHVQDMFRHLQVTSNGWTNEVNLQPIFFRLTLDSATEFLFGESVHSQLSALPAGTIEKDRLSTSIGLDLAEVARAFDRATHMLGKRARFAELYFIYNPKQFRDDCKLVHKFADYYVHRALAKDLSTELEKGDAKQRYVFLDELAKQTRDPVELRSQLLNIFLAGRDTTAGLLGWVFWVLARHPDIFDKLRATVIEMFGTYHSPKEITFGGLKDCTYLQHVMSETLRLYPSVPINSRRAVKDTSIPLGGGPDGTEPVFVPKGTQVDYSVHVMHRRKDLWGEDALEFKPERWQGRKVGWEFLPFNGGPRICLGQQFALTEAGYVIVRLLQKFDKIENLDSIPENDPQFQYSVTTAPWQVPLKLREAKE
ncbi:hypothetical protein H2198_003053 [Neophaeococcomyces mojaviensis]|uniref:Uncharacterized protein n=1 Tax=Neophaeococcomyces mojaviensis TaxID=3383035 RepID=A0ACC3ACK8_9EURO|nr:hypothetical protein H2198_003053 [Knufia sp. JES_112]